ncbi:MAG TPA: hypothetical protein VMB50_17415 [Myxococcales bacterium]|nr:hypothetical protein [Myxococcales bacterium]
MSARVCSYSWLVVLAACSSGAGGSSGGSSGTAGSSGARSSTGSGSSTGRGTTGTGGYGTGTGGQGTGTGGSSSGTSSGTASSSSSGGSAGADYRFPSTSVFYQDISGATADPNSAAVMAAIGSWGGSGDFQIDFSMNILYGNSQNPMQPFTEAAGYYSPDCDDTPFPQLPADGGIEGQEGTATPYGCPLKGDCHLLVYQGHWLFEMYNAVTDTGQWNGNLTGLCEVAWDLTHDYWTYGATPYSRGDQCTSTDAAGMPVAPLLVTGADLASGVVAHALRFILPNDKMQAGYYLHPGTHAGGPTGAAPLPIYGSRFRLRSSFDVTTLPNAAAQAVAVALQKYGMFLDDGGNIPLTFDQSAQAYIGSHDLGAIQVSDFELIDSPDPAVTLTYDCERTPLTTTN